jgi:hypothetical protein
MIPFGFIKHGWLGSPELAIGFQWEDYHIFLEMRDSPANHV